MFLVEHKTSTPSSYFKSKLRIRGLGSLFLQIRLGHKRYLEAPLGLGIEKIQPPQGYSITILSKRPNLTSFIINIYPFQLCIDIINKWEDILNIECHYMHINYCKSTRKLIFKTLHKHYQKSDKVNFPFAWCTLLFIKYTFLQF